MGVRILYGIASCDSCRNARKWLTAESIDFEFHDLRSDGLDIQMLEQWCDRIDWQKLLNKRSITWRNLPEADRRGMKKDWALTTMIQSPTLVKRPVLECDEFIVLGFSAEVYGSIFEKIGVLNRAKHRVESQEG